MTSFLLHALRSKSFRPPRGVCRLPLCPPSVEWSSTLFLLAAAAGSSVSRDMQARTRDAVYCSTAGIQPLRHSNAPSHLLFSRRLPQKSTFRLFSGGSTRIREYNRQQIDPCENNSETPILSLPSSRHCSTQGSVVVPTQGRAPPQEASINKKTADS